MNIQPVNMYSQSFNARVRVTPESEKALYNTNLQEFLKNKQYVIEEYADKHNIKEVLLSLKKAVTGAFNIKRGELLMVNAGPKTAIMRFDNTTTEAETEGTILGNIQENYNLIHKK